MGIAHPILMSTSNTVGPSNTVANHHPLTAGPNSTGEWNASTRPSQMPVAGVLSDLVVSCATAIVTGSYAFTVTKNGVDQTLSCTLSSAGTLTFDHTNTVTVAAGDLVAIKCTPTGTPTAITTIQISLVFTATGNAGAILSGAVGGTVSGTLSYAHLGSWAANTGTASNVEVHCPCAGTLSAIYTWVSAAPGGTLTRKATLQKNGVDTTLTATITGAATTANLTGQSVSVAKGDKLNIKLETTTTVAAGQSVSFDFTPTTAGDYPLFNVVQGAISTSAQSFGSLQGRSIQSLGENAHRVIAPAAFTVKEFNFLAADPGVGKTRTALLRINTTNSGQSAVLSSGQTSTNWTGTQAIAQNDFINFANTPAGTPNASGTNPIYSTVVSMVAAAAGADPGDFFLMFDF